MTQGQQPVVEKVDQLIVDPNDPRLAELGARIALGLVEKVGAGEAIAVLTTGLYQALWGVLHATTPMPEANIAQINRLLDDLHAKVRSHEKCALHINDVPKKAVVH